MNGDKEITTFEARMEAKESTERAQAPLERSEDGESAERGGATEQGR